MPFIGLTKPAIVTTPSQGARFCYDFHRKLSASLIYPSEWLRYFLGTHREPFIEHFPETLPGLRLKRGDLRYTL